MTSSNVNALLTDRLSESADDVDTYSEIPTFGWLRGLRDTVPMLELRKKSGNILAITYASVERVEFDPSEGIFLDVGDQRIAVRGRNLNAEVRSGVRLFEGLTRHRVPWIREASSAELMQADDRACVIESIDW